MYHVQAQLLFTTADGWQGSRQVPTLAVPLATSAHNAAVIVHDAVTMLRDSQFNIRLHAAVWDPDIDPTVVESFVIEGKS